MVNHYGLPSAAMVDIEKLLAVDPYKDDPWDLLR